MTFLKATTGSSQRMRRAGSKWKSRSCSAGNVGALKNRWEWGPSSVRLRCNSGTQMRVHQRGHQYLKDTIVHNNPEFAVGNSVPRGGHCHSIIGENKTSHFLPRKSPITWFGTSRKCDIRGYTEASLRLKVCWNHRWRRGRGFDCTVLDAVKASHCANDANEGCRVYVRCTCARIHPSLLSPQLL